MIARIAGAVDPCPDENWTEAASTPAAMSRYGFAQDGELFYVIAPQHFYRYEVAGGNWTTLAPMPRGLLLPGVAHHGGKLYAAGGYDDGLINDFFIYDVATNTWSAGPAMPMFSYGSAAGVYGGKLFVVVGTSWQSLAIFDLSTQTWTIGPDVPSPCRLAGSAQVGSYLYLIGGLGNGCGNTTSRRLDMSSVTWSTGPAWTTGRGDFGIAFQDGKVYAMGGRAINESVPSAEVWELDVASWPAGTWTRRLPDLPSPREANQAGFSSNGRIWSTGGYGAGQVHTLQHIYLTLGTDDGDGDGAAASCDCNDADASVWSTPGEVHDLTVSTSASQTLLSWNANAQPGAASVTYDTLRSAIAADFVTSVTCVESSDGIDLMASDAFLPTSGEVAYYLVRSLNNCPGPIGTGPAGTASIGIPRVARSCP